MANIKEKITSVKEKAVKAHGFINEFKEFLNEYKVIGIAAGLVIGSAVTSLVQSIVVGIITPALQMLIPSEAIRGLGWTFNGVTFQFGAVIAAFINFVIIAFLFFLMVKVVLKKEKVTKI